MTKASAYLLVFILFSCLSAFGQGGRVKIEGRVLDEATNEPVIGASISLAGSKGTGTVSDVSGNFVLNVNSLPVTISVHYIGYKKQDVDVRALSKPIIVQLQETVNALTEVVVVGYGTQKRQELTGAIASVSPTTLKQHVVSFDNLLGGAVAGLNVTQSSGAPGATSTVRIRGSNSIAGGNEPLYVVDGYILYNDNTSTRTGLGGSTSGVGGEGASAGTVDGGLNPLTSINPADIASIDVLKDVAATAIYGSRGANGVIIITTKKGSRGRDAVNYQFTLGTQRVNKKLDLLNAEQWAGLFTEISPDGKSPYQHDYANRLLPQGQTEDWQSAVFQTAYSQNHSLSLNGGGNDYRYLLSFSYNDETGIVRNTGLKRYIGRINLDKDLFKKLNVGANITIGQATLQGLTNQGGSNTYNYAVRVSPLVPVHNKNSDDGYNYANPFETTDYRIGDKTPNPISDLLKSTVETRNISILGNAYAQYPIIPQLVAKINAGVNINHATQNFYAPSTSARGLLVNGYAGVGNKDYSTTLLEFTLNYKNVFAGIHSVEALAGYTTEHSENEYSTAGASGFKNEALTYHSLQSGESRDTPTSGGAISNINSFLGRVNYSLLERYNLSASFRADGSSRFSPGHKWGYFPSVGVSWNIDKESFFSNSKALLSQLKFRASAGQVGNQEIGDYLYSRLYTPRNYSFGNQIVVGYTATNYGNSDLRWESTAQYNAGIDFGLFDNHLNFVIDAYYKLTSDLLVDLPVERTSGLRTKMTNIGNISNKGVEFSVNAIVIDRKNLLWEVTANISTNRNRIEKLGTSGFISGSTIVDVGLPLGTFYGYVFDGIVQPGEESSTPVPTWQTGDKVVHAGDAKFADRGGDPNSIDNNDRVVLGDAQADFIYGFSTRLNYSQFDLSASFQGSYGNKLYNAFRNTLETPSHSYNGSAVLANRWTPVNTNTNIPRAIPIPYTTIDSRYIEDASYLRMKDITLGYTLRLTKAKTAPSVRLFVSAQNLFVLTKYTGYDPEGARNGFSDLEIGVDNGVYPRAKSFLAGLGLSF
ncbi:MAG: TonB-dependent receptor [Tannerellaceae bacterium]|jgi:TonB-linked SusC/RagA family outer membrane protein|nr:TonB-dependent receptor [Tannerellaceae bacterium]